MLWHSGDVTEQPDGHTVAAMFAEDRASKHLGMTIDRSGDGHAVVSMTVTDDMVNGLGIGHGGLVFALADSAMAFATNDTGTPAVAVQAEIDWLRPAQLGARLTATAHRVHEHGRNAITDVTVADEHGETIAVFRGRTRLLKGQPPKA